MKVNLIYNEDYVKKLIENDSLLKFRLKLLLELEKKDYGEALHEIYNKHIIEDVFRLKEYQRLQKNFSLSH